MAVLVKIDIAPMIPDTSKLQDGIIWTPDDKCRTIYNVPQIFYDNGEPWLVANYYALEKLESTSGNDIKTVISNMGHLKAYACWLEDNCLDWRHFPIQKKERCLFRYRGFLIEQRDSSLVSPSTATTRMGAIVQFYRWAKLNSFIERRQFWEDREKSIQFYTTTGFSRTMGVMSSELTIPNRQRNVMRLEQGLLPLSNENQNILLRFLYENNKKELYLMCKIGFLTGARSETIRSLRLESIENTIEDPSISSILRVAVGPGTKVKTKYNVKGSIAFPKPLIKELEEYAYSIRRLRRQAKMKKDDDRTLLFITERGNAYTESSFTKLISYLREKLMNAGLYQFKRFKFHQTRATFGTQLMKVAMDVLPSQVDAIVFVRDALLHKDESTTWKYVKFIETEPLKESISNEFFNLFIGASGDTKMLIDLVTYEDA